MVIAKKQQQQQQKNKKKTRGRQKIEIKPIQGKSSLQVTFSKRRSGLLKKAGELSLLCGAKVAILAFSPGNKAFAFGHPSVDSIVDQFLNGQNDAVAGDGISNDPQVKQWNREYEAAVKELEEEKKRALAAESGGFGGGFWWDDEKIEGLGLKELEEYVRAMQELKRNVGVRANELMMSCHLGNQNLVGGGEW